MRQLASTVLVAALLAGMVACGVKAPPRPPVDKGTQAGPPAATQQEKER